MTVVDDLSTGTVTRSRPGATLFPDGYMTSPRRWCDPDLDAVLHFAAFIAAGESVAAPEKYWENNVLGSLRCSTRCGRRRTAVRLLLHRQHLRQSGRAADHRDRGRRAAQSVRDQQAGGRVRAHRGRHGAWPRRVSLRYFNAAGALIRPEGSCGERHDPETHLIPNALLVAAGVKEKLPLYGDDYPTSDGTCVRDYIHVADLATAHLAALGAVRPGEHRVYNLGNGTGFSNQQVVQAVREVTGHPIPVEMAPRRPGDPAVLVASSDKARAELGWTPRQPGLHEIIADAWTFAQTG